MPGQVERDRRILAPCATAPKLPDFGCVGQPATTQGLAGKPTHDGVAAGDRSGCSATASAAADAHENAVNRALKAARYGSAKRRPPRHLLGRRLIKQPRAGKKARAFSYRKNTHTGARAQSRHENRAAQASPPGVTTGMKVQGKRALYAQPPEILRP